MSLMDTETLTGLALSLPIGVASGLYSSLVVSKIARFSALRSECLRVVRGIDFIGEGNDILITGAEYLNQLPLIAGEMMHLGHKRSGMLVSELYSAILSRNIEAQRGQISLENYGKHFSTWQAKTRDLNPSIWQLYWPFSKL